MSDQPRSTTWGDGRWGRLKAPISDPLEAIGLPSKGETRLAHFSVQERYYDHILDRCLQLCYSTVSMEDDLEHLHLGETEESVPKAGNSHASYDKETRILEILCDERQSTSRDLTSVLHAIRKLREALIATARLDPFACNVFLFGLRFAILLVHQESYIPAMLYLLHKMPRNLFPTNESASQVRDFCILDLACRQQDLNAAYSMILKNKFRRSRVHDLVQAISHGNWVRFERISAGLDKFEQNLAENASLRLRSLAVQALGRTYLQIEEAYFHDIFHLSWADVQKEQNLTWPLVDGKVLIKQAKRQ